MAEKIDIIAESERMRLKRKQGFDSLKHAFGLSFEGRDVPLIDNKRVISAEPITLMNGFSATAVLFDHYNGRGSGLEPVEERLIVTLNYGTNESKWEVSEAGLKSYNSSVKQIEIGGQCIDIQNPNYPFSGWVDDTDTLQVDDFHNMIASLVSVFSQQSSV